MGLLIFFFALSIGFSFLCSILEAVLLSITPAFIRQETTAGSTTGKLFTAFKADIDRPLSAILTLNTIAHTTGAIGVGAQAGKVFGETMISLGGFSISVESIVATVMTLAILVFSEIIPKTLGANYWRSLAPFSAQAINFLVIILKPLVWLSQSITKSMKNDDEKSVLSRVDIAAMAKESAESGLLDKREHEIIANLLAFEKLNVKKIMTPKKVMFMVEEDLTLEEFFKEGNFGTFSRIPIFNDNRDNITGFVLKDEVLTRLINGKGNEPVKSIKREINFVRETMLLTDLFKEFSKERQHLAVVTDEFGDVLGVVTMEDMFETMLGVEIMDESDKIADLQEHARKQWKERSQSKQEPK